MNGVWYTVVVVLALSIFFPEAFGRISSAATCAPTISDELGPFYKPNAPKRLRVGKGYAVQGIVRSSADCSAVPGAVLELWLAGPDGEYDDEHRATVIADASGAYRFESNVPPTYFGRPPHIHLRISAKGFQTLVTQHYPGSAKNEAVFDIVLVPSR